MKFTMIGEHYTPEVQGGLVTGYSVATDDLTKAFLQWSQAEEIGCVCRPDSYQASKLREIIRNLPGKKERERVKLINELDLLFYGAEKMPQVDVLHSVKEEFQALITFRENLRLPIPVTFTLHGIAEQHLITDMFSPLLLWPFKPYDAVFCSSESVYKTVDAILSRLKEQIEYVHGTEIRRRIRLEKVPLGIDTDRFRPLDKQCSRENLEIPQNAFVILWFGRFSDLFKSDLHPLLQTFKNLLNRNPGKELLLILAGSQDSMQYAEVIKRDINALGISDHVKILFHKDITDRPELYNAADVFTSPIDNLQETFGLTPLEAMSCGVPQVVSDWDGYKDTVEDGITGFRIPVYWTDCQDDLASRDCFPVDRRLRRLLYQHLSVRSTALDCNVLYDRLQKMIDDPVLRLRMSAASRERAVKHYDIKNTVSRVEGIWNNLLEIASKDRCRFGGIPTVDYCHDFISYPTRMLDGRDLFCLTDMGRKNGLDQLPEYKSFKNNIAEFSLARQIYNQMLAQPPGTYLSMDQIWEYNPSWTEAQCKREIMYLFKYGILQLGSRP